MDIRQLKAFAKVYEHRSFSKAAEALFLSQPTISAHIGSLEQELGISFFDRLGRGNLPTQAADILYAHCKTIFTALDRAESEIRLLSNKVSGELTIGGSTIPANFLLPGLLSRFLHLHPDVSISLIQGDSMEIVQRVLRGDLALGVVGAKEDIPELEFQPLFEDSLVVLASSGFLKKISPPYTLKTICKLPWVVRQHGSGTRMAMENALERAGFKPRELQVLSVVDSTEALLRLIRCGLGISVTSRLAAEEYLQRGELVVLDIPELHFQRSFYVVYHPQRHQFPATRFFLEFITETMAKTNGQCALTP
jgi:DNA-binding transcriptional LysR family regulator